jgi:hypothetical protein
MSSKRSSSCQASLLERRDSPRRRRAQRHSLVTTIALPATNVSGCDPDKLDPGNCHHESTCPQTKAPPNGRSPCGVRSTTVPIREVTNGDAIGGVGLVTSTSTDSPAGTRRAGDTSALLSPSACRVDGARRAANRRAPRSFSGSVETRSPGRTERQTRRASDRRRSPSGSECPRRCARSSLPGSPSRGGETSA